MENKLFSSFIDYFFMYLLCLQSRLTPIFNSLYIIYINMLYTEDKLLEDLNK